MKLENFLLAQLGTLSTTNLMAARVCARKETETAFWRIFITQILIEQQYLWECGTQQIL